MPKNAHRTQNLAERRNHDISVSLDYDPIEREVSVTVVTPNEEFTLYPPNSVALDCFHHPYAYAQRVLTSGTFAS